MQTFNAIKRIHFVGIGGSGMSGIAEVLLNSGYEISGSDIKKSASLDRLKDLGAKIYVGHAAENINNAQVVVFSSAIQDENPELLAAKKLKLPIIHRSEILTELMRTKYGIIIAGTHGKTTTTSILASALHDIDLDPTVVIGGKLNIFDSHAKLGKGELFIAESDESDGSFLRFNPTIAVITNIDQDHLDYYKSFEEIIKAFETFIDKVPFYGAVCACIDDPTVKTVLPKVRRKLITYGLSPEADVTATDVRMQGLTSQYTPVIFGKHYPAVKIKLPGKYNIVNSLATFAVAALLHLEIEAIGKALARFDGVLHRFTILAEINNVTIVDDYAHNPKKIETVLTGITESFPNKKIIAIFQPHRYTRLAYQLPEFAKSFKKACKVIVTPIYAASEPVNPEIDQNKVSTQIKEQSFANKENTVYNATTHVEAATIALNILKEIKPGQEVLILTLGAGDVSQIGQIIKEKLSFNVA